MTILYNRPRGSLWMILAITAGIAAGNLASAPSVQAAAPDLDIIVLVEDTAAIAQLDPLQKRKTALKLLLSMLDERDRASVIGFGSGQHPLTELLEINQEKNMQQLYAAIDKLSGQGAQANLPDALAAAKAAIENDVHSSDRELRVIMLTQSATAATETSLAQQAGEESLEPLLLWFKTSYIPVHVVSIGNNAQHKAMKNVAAITQGSVVTSESAEQLLAAFRRLMQVIKQRNITAVTGQSFKVDPSMTFFKLLLMPGNEDLVLIDPSGDRMSAQNAATTSNWHSSGELSAVTVSNPQTGTWKIQDNDSPTAHAMLIFPDTLRLRHQVAVENTEQGKNLNISAWLEKNGQTITDRAMLQFMQVRLRLRRDGKMIDEQSLFPEPKHSGRFFANIRLTQAGEYRFILSMEDENLYRQASFGQTFAQQITNVKVQPENIAAKPHRTPAQDKSTQVSAVGADTAGNVLADMNRRFPDLRLALIIATAINGVFIAVAVLLYSRQRMRQQVAQPFDFVTPSANGVEKRGAARHGHATA